MGEWPVLNVELLSHLDLSVTIGASWYRDKDTPVHEMSLRQRDEGEELNSHKTCRYRECPFILLAPIESAVLSSCSVCIPL
jgi:hypothetical protein